MLLALVSPHRDVGVADLAAGIIAAAAVNHTHATAIDLSAVTSAGVRAALATRVPLPRTAPEATPVIDARGDTVIDEMRTGSVSPPSPTGRGTDVPGTQTADILTELYGDPAVAADADLPGRLVTMCAAGVPVTGAGIIVMTDSGPGAMLASTDGPARTMEELQFTLGEGPCVDASRSGQPVLQPDLARTAPGRWPGFADGALEAGVRAVFAFPLQVGGIRVGVLDLYRDVEGLLGERQLAVALAFADAATSILLHLQAQPDADGAHLGLVSLVDDRAEIHQATGMVSIQAALGLAEALVLLRAHAYAAERPILSVARDVIARDLHFHPEDDHHE